MDSIVIRGAREHNLKNIDVVIPRNKFVVITRVSGSGKSSLAFDTIYAEGQRRYVESLSAYARQFLGQMDKPDVDHIDGLSPAVSIDQKTTSNNPRSTVATVTEIYDYLRLLYARAGRPHCHVCGFPVASSTPQQMVETALNLAEGLVQIETVERDGAGESMLFSENFTCTNCGASIAEIQPRTFSFNSPHGACDRCDGLGSRLEIDPDLVVPNADLSVNEGAVVPWAGSQTEYHGSVLQALAEKYGIDLDAPWRELPEEHKDLILFGTNGDRIYVSYRNRYGRRRQYMTQFGGVVSNLERRYVETDSEYRRGKNEEVISPLPRPRSR